MSNSKSKDKSRCPTCGFRRRGSNHAEGSHHLSAVNGKGGRKK